MDILNFGIHFTFEVVGQTSKIFRKSFGVTKRKDIGNVLAHTATLSIINYPFGVIAIACNINLYENLVTDTLWFIVHANGNFSHPFALPFSTFGKYKKLEKLNYKFQRCDTIVMYFRGEVSFMAFICTFCAYTRKRTIECETLFSNRMFCHLFSYRKQFE